MRNWNQNQTSGHCTYRKVASLPMRNWNWLYYNNKKRRIIVASLPMRNWNYRKGTYTARSGVSCEPTYEELKRLPRFGVFKVVTRLRAYLWGIETRMRRAIVVFKCFRLRAYLWGIETCERRRKIRDFHRSCEPTYEELKLEFIALLSKLIDCCEPTYEELKPVENNLDGSVYVSCEPTYEELKQ